MSWQDLYIKSMKELGIQSKTKRDIYNIMVNAINTMLNADNQVKEDLLAYLNYTLSEYNSHDGYLPVAVVPVQFIHYLSIIKHKTITRYDIEPPNLLSQPPKPVGLTPDDAQNFATASSDKTFARAKMRASLKLFSKYLVSRSKLSKDPFFDLKIKTPKSKRKIVYNLEMLDEFYNIVMFGAKEIYRLYWRLVLQTGLRPGHAYTLKLEHIDYNRPVNDALGRKFYPVYVLEALTHEKESRNEIVIKKNPPEFVYMSEELWNEIKDFCAKNGCPDGYIFKNNFVYESLQSFISKNRDSEKIKPKLKYQKDKFYIMYPLRDTWASVVYNISLNLRDLTDYGGWESETTALKFYVNAFEPKMALDIAKKWGIFIRPEWATRVKAIENEFKASQVSPEEKSRDETIKVMQGQMELLMTQLAALEKKMGGVKESFSIYS